MLNRESKSDETFTFRSWCFPFYSVLNSFPPQVFHLGTRQQLRLELFVYVPLLLFVGSRVSKSFRYGNHSTSWESSLNSQTPLTALLTKSWEDGWWRISEALVCQQDLPVAEDLRTRQLASNSEIRRAKMDTIVSIYDKFSYIVSLKNLRREGNDDNSNFPSFNRPEILIDAW